MALTKEKSLADEADSSSPLISKKVFSSSSLLVARQAITQIIGALTGVLIARWGTPEDFGFYAIFSFFYYLLLSPGDLGLGASLVRQKESPSKNECRQVLTVRHAVDLLLVATVWFCAPLIADAYGMPQTEGTLAIRLMSLATALHSFQVIPMVLLERNLSYGKVAFIEIVQIACYSTLAIYLTLESYGVLTFAYAWLAYSFSGALLASFLQHWPIGWRFSTELFRERKAFALPYQASNALALGKDAVTPIIVGILLGATQVGYLNWAQMLATIAALTVLILHRVFFSAFSKIQDDKVKLGEMTELAIRFSHGFAAFPALLLLVLAEPITVIVFGETWLTALPLFYALWPANLIIPTLPAVIAVLYALGFSAKVFRINLALTSLFFLTAFALIQSLGSIGYVPAFLLYYLANLWLVAALKSCKIEFSILKSAAPVWPIALVCAAVSLATFELLQSQTLLNLLLSCVLGGLSYCLLVWLFRQKLFVDNFLHNH